MGTSEVAAAGATRIGVVEQEDWVRLWSRVKSASWRGAKLVAAGAGIHAITAKTARSGLPTGLRVSGPGPLARQGPVVVGD